MWTLEIQQPYRVADSFPISGKLFVEFILFSLWIHTKKLDLPICNYVKTWLNVCTNMPDLPTWCNHGKTPMKRNWQSQVKDPIYYLCLSSCVVTLWSTKQEVQIILSIATIILSLTSMNANISLFFLRLHTNRKCYKRQLRVACEINWRNAEVFHYFSMCLQTNKKN